MSSITASPGTFEMTTGEVVTIQMDLSPILQTGQTPTLAGGSVTNLTNNQTISGVVSNPSLSGNILSLTLTGSALRPNQQYRLVGIFTPSGSPGPLNVDLILNVLY